MLGEETDKVEEEHCMASMTREVVETKHCGELEVYVEGNLENLSQTVTVFLTVHDVGSSYLSWTEFTNHLNVKEIKKKSIFLHLCICGQAPGAEALPTNFSFPSMQELGMDLVMVLDQLKVQTVVALGDGAGANIVMQFAMAHPERVWGVVLINCSAVEGPDAVDTGFLASPRMLVGINRLHKDKISKSITSHGNELNTKNVRLFEEMFRKRPEILSQLSDRMSFDTLLITGTRSRARKHTQEIYEEVKPGNCSIIKLEEVDDVLREGTDKLVDAIILFCQGLGLMPSARRRTSRSWSVSMQESNMSRRKSMEHLHDPYLSLTSRIKSISLTVPAPLAPRPSVLARFGVE